MKNNNLYNLKKTNSKRINKTLCVISHTEHYFDENKKIVGWGTTILELNHLADAFENVYHIAMLHEGQAPPSSLPYNSDRIKFIALPPLGGKTLISKIRIIENIPKVIRTVNSNLKEVDFFQFRGPTGIGVFLIPYLIFLKNKIGWFKYAGNWNQKNAPFGYSIQRFFLRNQRRTVTINGKWPKQPKQCLTFENPTLTDEDVKTGKHCVENKDYTGKLNFCFVGRLEDAKGVELILEAFNNISDPSQRIGTIHFVGEGEKFNSYIDLARKNSFNCVFHGGLPREKVFEVYAESHVFLLPSIASEGFPKVIAEAICYGCVPVVSNVSSITQYIKSEHNGFVLQETSSKCLIDELSMILSMSSENFKKLFERSEEMIKKFTFKHYIDRIKNEILVDDI